MSTSFASVEIYAHRGASSLFAESTLPAYEAAVQMGVTTIDMDVALTKDNVVVVNHDQRLATELTRDGKGKWLKKPGPYIRQLSLAELKTYDVGALNPKGKLYKTFPEVMPRNNVPTPTLSEVIRATDKLTDGKIRYQIEIKTTPNDKPYEATPEEIVPALLKVLREEDVLDRTEVHSFDWRNLLLIKKEEPRITLSFLTEQDAIYNNVNPVVGTRWTAGYRVEDYQDSVPKMIASLGGKVWCPSYTDLTPDLVKDAHKHHLKVVVWTVDHPDEMQRMIAYGVDGIITNYPQVLRKIISST